MSRCVFFWQSKNLVTNVIPTILSSGLTVLHNFCFHFSGSLSIKFLTLEKRERWTRFGKWCFSSVNERQRFMFAFIGKRLGNTSLILFYIKHENLLILLCTSSTNRRMNIKRIFVFWYQIRITLAFSVKGKHEAASTYLIAWGKSKKLIKEISLTLSKEQMSAWWLLINLDLRVSLLPFPLLEKKRDPGKEVDCQFRKRKAGYF